MKTNCNSECFGISSKTIFFILFLSVGLFASVANAQSLATDQADYAPNSTATISGFGFQIGENVTMQVTYADGSPLPAPYSNTWVVTADVNGSFITTWIVCNCPWASLVATANGDGGSYADVYFTDSGVDFQQAGNENHPTDPINWLNGIAQSNTSDYFEGMGTPQRIIFFDIPSTPGDNHTLTMEHQAVKGDNHAYDFMISWPQAIVTAANIGNGSLNELLNLDAQTCGLSISATAASVCAAAQALGAPPHANIALPVIPDAMGNPPNHDGTANVNDVITCFEAIYGDRTIEIRGNAPITASSVVFTGYTGTSTGDNYAAYTINWTSSATNIMIRLAGRSAVGAGSPCGYGQGFGAGGINGGPYHFKLHQLDGASLGSQDNQLTAPDEIESITCDSVDFSGPTSICPNSTGNVYSATVNGCTSASHNWFISNNTSGAVISGSNTGASVSVDAGSSCGGFNICDSVICGTDTVVCCYAVNVVDQTDPVFSNCTQGSDLGCNPTVPTCGNQTAPSATDNCGTPTVTCSAGSIINTSTCSRSRTITWTATDACGNTSTCSATWTWTEDTTPPVLVNCPTGSDLGCNPTIPTCANITPPTATDNCGGTPTVTCSAGSIISTSTCGRSRTITWTATDDCANTSTCSATWTWTEDTTPPVLSNCP
ncbi:MAG TPA: hypothetical protein VI757_07095, partial [Bacteroidia bacterium]|nr:hypothetical protein [Bacteroidia bacterium]